MKEWKGRTTLGTTWRFEALLSLTILTACATASSGGGRYVDNPEEWQAIDLTGADLNLPQVAPLKIGSLERRKGDGILREEIYTFQGVEGYVKTSRVIGDIYPDSAVQSIRGGTINRDYIASLSLPAADTIVVPVAWAFLNGKSHAGKFLSRGFAAEGAAPPHYTHCFVSRVAYLLVELEAAERSDDAFDTVVEVLLCGNRSRKLPRHTDFVQMMARIDAVRDREALHNALRGAGTI